MSSINPTNEIIDIIKNYKHVRNAFQEFLEGLKEEQSSPNFSELVKDILVEGAKRRILRKLEIHHKGYAILIMRVIDHYFNSANWDNIVNFLKTGRAVYSGKSIDPTELVYELASKNYFVFSYFRDELYKVVLTNGINNSQELMSKRIVQELGYALRSSANDDWPLEIADFFGGTIWGYFKKVDWKKVMSKVFEIAEKGIKK